MNVVSYCPLRVSCLRWQPRHDACALTVICKATFDLRPGESPLAAAQEDIWDDAARVSDLVPFKRRADVFVVGRAYPPNSQTASVVARIGVGSWQKAVDAQADRQWIVAGMGPIPSTASTRVALLGRHAASWDHQAWHKRPLPQDVDGAFFNAAPFDQQLDGFGADELLRLETKLARVVPHVLVQRSDKPVQDVRLRCDTLVIDTDKLVAMLVWRGVAVLSSDVEQALVIVTAEGTRSDDAASTLMLPVAVASPPGGAALPFVKDKPAGPNMISREENAPRTASPSERNDDEITGTMPLWYAVVATTLKPVTPFDGARQTRETQTVPEDEPGPQVTSVVPMPFDVPAPAFVGDAPLSSKPVVDEPPMMGPLVGAKPFENQAVVTTTVSETRAEANPSATDDVSVMPTSLPEPELDDIELTLEQVATVAAELAEGKTSRAKVFETHGLRERSWRKNEKRWSEAIEAQSARGTHAMQAAYDAVYVARVEAFRGPIELQEYAQIVVGLERGNAPEVLAALKIQRPALMPIVRLWTRKVAKDMKLGDAANDVLRALRRA
jgi:hypothetical protein